MTDTATDTPDLSRQFAGQYAVVTGSTQGLGEAVARLFAARGGAGLIVCGRNARRGAAVASDINQLGCETIFVESDLADIDDCRKIVAAADNAFGNVHMLANCAGMTDRGTILDTSPELFDRMFAINVRAPFFLMQDCAKIMIREGTAGAMINVLSMSSHGGQPFISAYCGSKGALATLTKNIAFSLMRKRIRVNGLNIGWMDSPGEDRIQKEFHGAGDDWLEKAEATLPFGRLIKPQEVARMVAFLASAESGLITGSLIDFDQSVDGCYESPPLPAAAG